MNLDIQLFYLLNGVAGQSVTLDGVIVFVASYLPYLTVAVFIILVVLSQYSRQEKWELFLVAGAASIIARLGVTELIRFFYHHPRPFVALPDVHQLLTDSAWSFPSGHATFFFAMATAIYLYNKQWGTGFLLAAVLITVGRVIAGVHYPSDILGGAIIGGIIAFLTVSGARTLLAEKTHQTY